jgi:hypothetical protein
VPAPVAIGDVIVADIADFGVDVVATQPMPRSAHDEVISSRVHRGTR